GLCEHGYGSDQFSGEHSWYLYCHQYHRGIGRMCGCNSNKFCYYNYIACSYNQLCGHTFLYFTGWSAGCNADRRGWWNLFFNCRINDQCFYGCHHTEHEHSRNLYGYLYDGRWRWMCCTDSYYFGHHNCFACSHDSLYWLTILRNWD